MHGISKVSHPVPELSKLYQSTPGELINLIQVARESVHPLFFGTSEKANLFSFPTATCGLATP